MKTHSLNSEKIKLLIILKFLKNRLHAKREIFYLAFWVKLYKPFMSKNQDKCLDFLLNLSYIRLYNQIKL